MTQDNEKLHEQPPSETTRTAGTPWHVKNPDGSVHGGNGIQPVNSDSPPGEHPDEPLTE
ncbi:hypothetical protein [Pseudomonas fragi]|jgi:hypothetical protein|uniref:hypothetical protein n=1 Tax=Pseudomonas fragi TaxID=296 RepID=UPI0015C6B67C|nr:hypothetical protein [Pseudomonas fragi]